MVRTPGAAAVLFVLAALVCSPAFNTPGGFVSGDAWRDNDWLNTRAFDAMAADAILTHGQLPLRNPLVGGGYPTIAHPSDGSWAPTLLPVLAFGVETGTKVNLILLLFLGGLGMFLLARDVGGLDPPAALFAGALLVVSGWLPSMLLVGFWNQTFSMLGPLVLWALLSESKDHKRPMIGGLLLALVLQQGGHGFSALAYVCAAVVVARAAIDSQRVALAAGAVLVASAPAAFGKHLDLPWLAWVGVVVAGGLLALPAAAPFREAIRPGAKKLAILGGTAVALGAARLAGLLELHRLGVSYDHELRRRGALWFPGEGTTWSFPSVETAARGTEEFWGGRFYEGLGIFVEGLLGVVPTAAYREQFGRQGPQMDHEYAYLGLTALGVGLAIAGLWGLRRRRAVVPLVVVGGIAAAFCFGPHLPPDFHFLLTEGLPGVGSFAQPIKYWNVFVLFALVLLAGVGFEVLLGQQKAALAGVFVLLLLWPAWQSAGAYGERFELAREELPPAPRFDQVALIHDLADVGEEPAAIEQASRDRFLRAFTRAPAASEYDLARSGTGLVSWYATLSLPEHAVPARYVTPEGDEAVNPRYRGELEGPARMEARGPNKIWLRIMRSGEGGTVVINQEALRASDWKATTATVRSEGGLLAVQVPPGVERVTLRYEPALLLAGLAASAIALQLWFLLVLPPKWLVAPAVAVLVGVMLWPDAATEPRVTWSHTGLQAGQLTELTLQGEAGNRPLPAGTEVRVRFPHWVYGAHVERPEGADGAEFGRWSLVQPLPERVRKGGTFEVALGEVRVPRSAGRGFAPLVWIDGKQVLSGRFESIEPGPAKHPVAYVPAAVAPGQTVPIHLQEVDEFGNHVGDSDDQKLWAREPGIFTVGGTVNGMGAHPVEVLVEPDPPLIAWADLHGHSRLSDGRGSPKEYFEEARERGLTVAALSDHDWQLEDHEWRRLLRATDKANEPGTFVTIPAVEVNLAGHEVAYFFDADRLAEVARGAHGGARTIAEETDLGRIGALPPDLVGDYGTEDLVLATHTSLAANMGTGFPLSEALPGHTAFEVYSAHGSSECDDCPRRVGGGDLMHGEAISSLHDALDAGMQPVLLAAGDGHDGRAGDPAWGAWPGGLAGLEVDELTRAGVLRAMEAGRIWGTTGERTMLQVRWAKDGASVRVRVVSPMPIEAIEVVGARDVIARAEAPEEGVWITLDDMPATDWRYVRVILPNGARAWGGTWFSD